MSNEEALHNTQTPRAVGIGKIIAPLSCSSIEYFGREDYIWYKNEKEKKRFVE